MNLQANKTIFIVCEGEGTEPNYFNSIRDIIIEKKLSVEIRISPLPKNEEEAFQLRPNAKKRELRNITPENETALKKYEIAEEFRAQPIRYVREAQMGLEDGTFDEVWAVFDKNGHPKHQEAFELAEKRVNGKKVNIVFSSIAFEYWIVLHFHQLRHAFLKSQCRAGDTILDCGTNKHANDCKGSLCICGYLEVHKLLSGYFKGMHNLYQFLKPNLYTAIDNAAWLRRSIPIADKKKPVYELNPYINIDHLMFILLQLPMDLIWFNNNEEIITDNIAFKIQRDGNTLRILIENTRVERFILREGSFSLANSSGLLHTFGDRKILDNNEFITELNLNEMLEFKPIYFLYKVVGEKYFITDL